MEMKEGKRTVSNFLSFTVYFRKRVLSLGEKVFSIIKNMDQNICHMSLLNLFSIIFYFFFSKK